MFVWNDTSIRLMQDFAAYTQYYKKLCAAVLPYVDKSGHTCDAGCGLGFLGRELSFYCNRVTGVEMNHQAASAARQLHSPAKNYNIIEGDIHLCPPKQPYDTMVCCFFGDTLESLLIAKRQCKGKLIMIKRDMDNHRFSTKYVKLWKQPLIEATFALEQWGVPYHIDKLTLEAGQPLHSLSDGVEFFTLYSQDIRSAAITEDEVLSRVLKGNEPFDYYLPAQRAMGIIVIDTKDINERELINRASYKVY